MFTFRLRYVNELDFHASLLSSCTQAKINRCRMAIEVVWDNTQRATLRVDFAGKWSWLELRRGLRVGFAKMRAVGQRVDLIFNMGDTTLPESPLMNLAMLQTYLPAHSGTLVFVCADPHQLATLETVYHVYREGGQQALGVQTLEQARMLLAHERHMLVSGERS